MIVRQKRSNAFFGAFGQTEDDALTNDQLVSKYDGAVLSSIPGDARMRIHRHNATLAGPPPKDGPLGYMLLPDTLANGSSWRPPDVLVRRTATERAKDLGWALGPAGDWSWASPNARMRRVPVNGQQDWSFKAELKRAIAPIAAVALSAVGLGAAAGLFKKAAPKATPVGPIEAQRALEIEGARIRAGQAAPGVGQLAGPAAGAAAGFLVAGPIGAAAGAAAGYLLTKKG